MAEPSVLYQTREGVATITLNRPRVLNALDLTLSAQLADAADAAARDRDVWVVVVRGAGRAFCSGMDRTLLSAGGIDEAFYRNWIRALNRLEDMDPLVVAVLHGYSIGGGLQLALVGGLDAALERLELVLDTYLSVSTPVQAAAAELLRHAPSSVSDAYCASRLAPATFAGAAFGTVRDAGAAAKILSRALPG